MRTCTSTFFLPAKKMYIYFFGGRAHAAIAAVFIRYHEDCLRQGRPNPIHLHVSTAQRPHATAPASRTAGQQRLPRPCVRLQDGRVIPLLRRQTKTRKAATGLTASSQTGSSGHAALSGGRRNIPRMLRPMKIQSNSYYQPTLSDRENPQAAIKQTLRHRFNDST